MSTGADDAKATKRCFVVMGFGLKTDLSTGRQLDLNKSYKLLIKPVVESKGFECIRADEMQYTGSVDHSMYEQLLHADVVIADLSTSNANAFYELGIRHALRPHTTIVIAEDKLAYPFNLNHVKIAAYTHLGNAIDYEEVERFRKVLGDTLDAVLQHNDADSPVYTYLTDLVPPSVQKKSRNEQPEKKAATTNNKATEPPENERDDATLAVLAEQGEAALENRDYISAKAFFSKALGAANKDEKNSPHDAYLLHRLALATYKAELPDAVSALRAAMALLTPLHLEHTNDPETVVLAGKIEKRLYEAGQGEPHLRNAIAYSERGYHLLRNPCHGVDLAFLLNLRVDSAIYNAGQEKITDMVLANRIRREVVQMCEANEKESGEKDRAAKNKSELQAKNRPADRHEKEAEQQFWTLANKAEAHFGLGETEEYKKTSAQAKDAAPAAWMVQAFEERIVALRRLLQKHGHLLNPAWREGSE